MTPEHDPVSPGAARNVTAQGEETEALRRECDLLSAVLETAGALVVVLDREGRIVRFNRACERATGYSFEEVKGQALWDLFLVPEEVAPVRAVFEQLQAGHFPNQHENHCLTKDGTRRLIAWSNTALLGSGGEVQYVIGTGIDITEGQQVEAQRDATLRALRQARDDLELQVAKRTAELQGANRILEDAIAERSRALEAMRESEGHLRSLMESAWHYAIYRIAFDPSLPYLARVVLASPSLGELLSTSDVYDLATWFANIHPDDLARCEEANRHSLESGVLFDEQFRVFVPESGEWRWVHDRSTPVFDSTGRLTHFNGLMVDITEQKRTERTLQAIAEFEDAIARVSGSFINLTPEQVDEGIRRALEMIGTAYHVDRGYVFQFSGDRSRLECIHEWCAQGVEPQIDKLKDLPIDRFRWTVGQIMRSQVIQVRSGSDLPPEASAERAEFEAHGLQSRIVMPMVYQGVPVGFVGFDSMQPRLWTEQSLKLQVIGDIIVNALEHRRAETALRESEEKFRGIVELANVGIAIVQDTRFRFVNPHFAAMLGYTADEMLGRDFMRYCTPDERDRIVDMYTRRARGEPVPPRYETAMVHKNGGHVYAEVSAGLIPYGGQQATFVFLRDITQRKLAERALQEAYQTLEQRVDERTRELTTLLEVSSRLASTLELEPLLGSILDELRSVVHCDGCTIYGLEDGVLIARAYRGQMGQETTMSLRWPADNPLDRLAIRGRKPVLVSDTRGDSSEAQAYRESMGELQETLFPHIGCWLGVPLIARGQVIGVLTLHDSHPNLLTQSHARFAMAFANQAAVAIENARLYRAEQNRREEAERRRRVAEGMREILAALNSRQTLNEMLDVIAGYACHVLASDAAALLRLDRSSGLLRIQAACNLDPEYAAQISMPLGMGTAGRALAERRPVVISDTAEATVYLGAGGSDRPEIVADLLKRLPRRFGALFSVPIIVKDEPHGAITFYYSEPHHFSEEEFRLALSVADQAALALENARLREQAEQAAAMQERGRLARELHDSVTQSLYSVTMYTEAAARLLPPGLEAAAEHLRDARDTAQEALREMRLMIYQLRPPALEKGGLAVALQVRLDAVERRGGMRADLIVEGEDRLPPAVQAELHQIAQEALNNALKHAHARQVKVHLEFGDAMTRLTVQDDGVGFDPADVQAGGGLGLPGMRERAQKIGGQLEIQSAPGQGTRVSIEVPTGGGG